MFYLLSCFELQQFYSVGKQELAYLFEIYIQHHTLSMETFVNRSKIRRWQKDREREREEVRPKEKTTWCAAAASLAHTPTLA